MGGKGLQRKLRKNKTEENNTDFDRLDRWVGVDPYAGRRIKTKEKRKLLAIQKVLLELFYFKEKITNIF